MTCLSARPKMAAYLQDQLRADESAVLRRHLLNCGICHQEYEYQARLSSPLRELPSVAPPPALATAIRLRLSAERRNDAWERWQVRLSNLMRPFALPAAGGLLTAMILFGLLIPAVYVSNARAAGMADDVPTILSTEPRFKEASPFPLTEDFLVEAWIDERGKITSFQMLNPTPNAAAVEKMLRLQSGNVLLTTMFEPATRFGQPTAGKKVLLFCRINIRG